MRRIMAIAAAVLAIAPAAAAPPAASAQLPIVQFQGTYSGSLPYINWAWWLTPSQKCLETQPFYGSEPAAPGQYPVIVYLHGNLADWGNNVEGQRFAQLAAAHGFVAAAFSYDSWLTWGSPADFDQHAHCMFSSSHPGNAIAQICARPKANCSNGFVLAGFSQGAAIAGRTKNLNPAVQAVWGMGLSGPNIPEARATPSGTRALPNNKLRINVGQNDIVTNSAGVPDLSALNAMTGQSCTAFNCLRADGSGYYVVSNSEVSSGLATHCYQFVNPACSLTPTFNSQFIGGTLPWSLTPNLSWAAAQIPASIVQPTSTIRQSSVVKQSKIPVHPGVLDAAGRLKVLPMTVREYALAHGADIATLLNMSVEAAASKIVVRAKFKSYSAGTKTITYSSAKGTYSATLIGTRRYRLHGTINGRHLRGRIRTRQAASGDRYVARGTGRLGGRRVRISGGGPNSLRTATLILR